MHKPKQQKLARMNTLSLLVLLGASMIAGASEPLIPDDFEFTIADIENDCEVYLRAEDWGEVNCSSDALSPFQRLCEARMLSEWDGEIHCMNPLWDLNGYCEVEMRTFSYGDIKCGNPGEE